eukprot:Gb_06497 [translate_table: standard]
MACVQLGGMAFRLGSTAMRGLGCKWIDLDIGSRKCRELWILCLRDPPGYGGYINHPPLFDKAAGHCDIYVRCVGAPHMCFKLSEVQKVQPLLPRLLILALVRRGEQRISFEKSKRFHLLQQEAVIFTPFKLLKIDIAAGGWHSTTLTAEGELCILLQLHWHLSTESLATFSEHMGNNIHFMNLQEQQFNVVDYFEQWITHHYVLKGMQDESSSATTIVRTASVVHIVFIIMKIYLSTFIDNAVSLHARMPILVKAYSFETASLGTLFLPTALDHHLGKGKFPYLAVHLRIRLDIGMDKPNRLVATREELGALGLSDWNKEVCATQNIGVEGTLILVVGEKDKNSPHVTKVDKERDTPEKLIGKDETLGDSPKGLV